MTCTDWAMGKVELGIGWRMTSACALPACMIPSSPQIAAIEVGADNSYGHPAPSTLAALKAAVPRVYRTDKDGTVRLTVDGDGMEVETDG